MGLIKAGIGALGGTLADQWKEFFYCESLDSDTLMAKGQKRITSRSSNTKGNDNLISNGSGIAVADGQCMMIVEQGKIVEVCAEAGEYTYNSSTEPTIFAGSLGKSILDTFKTVGKRFTYGGDTGKDQRVYYFNLKEIMGNKYGTATPIPFRVVDERIGLDVDISVRCNGEYSYKITDPMLFYVNVAGNVSDSFKRSTIDSQLKTELLTALQPAFGKLSEMGVRYSAVPAHAGELADALNEELSKKWREKRGIEVASFGVNSISASEEDEKMIKDLQTNIDPRMAAASRNAARNQAMKDAAKNTGAGGAMFGFAGMNMAAGNGDDIAELYKLGAQQEAANRAQKAKADTWKCSCGAEATGNFCTECGAKKPNNWKCSCGAENKGKFCSECGAKKPEGVPLYKCDKCGWEPEDPTKPPKFCPECGDPFDSEDVK